MTGIKIQQLIQTTAWWASHDIVLAAREFGYEITTSGAVRRKTGDGTHKWSAITTYDKTLAEDAGLGNVANTADPDKPVSHAQARILQPRLGNTAADDSAVNITDAAAGAEFNALKALGKTTVTGTPSPDNPATITGVNPTKITACGNNIFNPAVGSVTVNGVTITVAADGTITLDGTATATSYIHIFPLFNANPANGTFVRRLAKGKKYTLSCTYLEGAASGVATFYFLDEAGINYPVNDLIYLQITSNNSAVLTAGTAFTTGFSTSSLIRDGYIQILSEATFSAYKFRLQFEQGNTAKTWGQYTGAEYPITPTTNLYDLPDGTADSYDVVSGLETHNIGINTADDTINPLVSATNTNTVAFAHAPAAHGRFDAGFISSHFPWIPDSSDIEHSRIGGGGGAYIYVYINKSRLSGYSDSWNDAQKVTAFKTWLASHHVQTLYGLATPTTTQHTHADIPQPAPVANAWTDTGGIGADYTADPSIRFKEKSGYGIYTGLGVTAQGTPNMTVSVAAGTIYMADGQRFASGGNAALAVTAANTSNPRIDIIYVSATGIISYLAGTAAASPTVPTVPIGGQLLAQIAVAANATTITGANITDCRRLNLQEAWITPTLLNGWVAQDASRAPAYYKDNSGMVHLKGLVKFGTLSTAIFNLPAGYQTLSTRYFAVNSSNALGIVTISSTAVLPTVGNTSSLCLDGITYRAEQ